MRGKYPPGGTISSTSFGSIRPRLSLGNARICTPPNVAMAPISFTSRCASTPQTNSSPRLHHESAETRLPIVPLVT